MDNRHYFSISWTSNFKIKVKHASNNKTQRTIVPCLWVRTIWSVRLLNFLKKNKISRFKVWDDKIKDIFNKYRTRDLKQSLKEADYIVLSPGISLLKNKKLIKFKKKNNNRYRFILSY